MAITRGKTERLEDVATQRSTPAARRVGRRPARTAVLIVILAAAGLLLTACGSSTPSSSSSTPTTSSGSTGPAKADTITMKNFAFSPATITVAPGSTVTVTNDDNVAHTVTSSTQKFNTGDVNPGQSVTFKAPEAPGRYPYICMIHQFMHGTLVVS